MCCSTFNKDGGREGQIVYHQGVGGHSRQIPSWIIKTGSTEVMYTYYHTVHISITMTMKIQSISQKFKWLIDNRPFNFAIGKPVIEQSREPPTCMESIFSVKTGVVFLIMTLLICCRSRSHISYSDKILRGLIHRAIDQFKITKMYHFIQEYISN